MYNPYIVGKQIYLRHPTEDDVQGKWHEWFSDEKITKYMSDRFWPNSKEAQLEFYKSLIKGFYAKKHIYLFKKHKKAASNNLKYSSILSYVLSL